MVPAWYWPWVRWYLGEGEFKGDPKNQSRRPLGVPRPVPHWAWQKLRLFLAARKPQPVVPMDRGLAFWRRMGMWVTRIDHFPPSYAVAYGNGEYPVVVVPCLYGTAREQHAEGLAEYVKELQGLGFKVAGSQWGRGGTLEEARLEAEAAAFAVSDLGFDGWVMNGEKNYEGGARSAAYARRFRELQPTLPFGWSPESRLDLDHAVLQELGVAYMPQAYPLEAPVATLPFCVEWGVKFGYERGTSFRSSRRIRPTMYGPLPSCSASRLASWAFLR